MVKTLTRTVLLLLGMALIEPVPGHADGTLPFLFGDGTLPFDMAGKLTGNSSTSLSARFSSLNYRFNGMSEHQINLFESSCPRNMRYYDFRSQGLQGTVQLGRERFTVLGICYSLQDPTSPGSKLREIVAASAQRELRLSGQIMNSGSRQTFRGQVKGTNSRFEFNYPFLP